MTRTEKALEEYYKNPSICQHCGKIIKVPEGGRIYDTKRKKFCNSSCSASFNNKGKVRNPEGFNGLEIDLESYKKEICPQCGGKKDKNSILCVSCYRENISISSNTLDIILKDRNIYLLKLLI